MPVLSARDRALLLLARLMKAANKAKKSLIVGAFLEKSDEARAFLDEGQSIMDQAKRELDAAEVPERPGQRVIP